MNNGTSVHFGEGGGTKIEPDLDRTGPPLRKRDSSGRNVHSRRRWDGEMGGMNDGSSWMDEN